MGTTVNGIYLPSAGESGWDSEVNDNLRRLGDLAVNVKAFGAVGDGVVNDYVSVLAAYDAVSPGGTLYFPPGTYLINTALNVAKPLRIQGAGPGVTILKRTANVHGITPSAVTGCVIRDLTIEGVQSTGLRNISVYVQTNTVGLWVDNVEFKNQSSSCIGMTGTGIKDVFVTNCRANEVWEQFVDCIATDVTHLVVANNTMKATTTNADIPGVEPWFSILEPSGTTAEITHVRYIGNSCDFTGMAGADMNNAGFIALSKVATNGLFRHVVISANTVKQVGTFVKVDSLRWGTPTEGGSLVVTGNVFESARQHGMTLKPGFANSTYEDSMVITGNLIHGVSESATNTYDGILLDGFGNGGIIIANNAIKRHLGATGANMKYGVEVGPNIQRTLVHSNYAANTGTAPYIDGGTNNVFLNNYADGVDFVFDASRTRVVATASLPVGATAMNGKFIIEDAGAGNRNLIIYAGGERFRIDGGAAV